MDMRFLEVRDDGTTIPVLAMRMTGTTRAQKGILLRGGFASGHTIVVMALSSQAATADLYDWPTLGFGQRTMQTAHHFIERHFDTLRDGDVVDVEFLLGEREAPKVPEWPRYTPEDDEADVVAAAALNQGATR